MLLAWIAPRGIVAAATAGIFGPALVAAGHADAEMLLPITFGVIIATVLAHGLSIGSMARRLNLAAKGANGLLIVGASPWTGALARALKALEIDVMLVDGSYWRLKDVRMAGIDVYYDGSINIVGYSHSALTILATFVSTAWGTSTTVIPTCGSSSTWKIVNNPAYSFATKEVGAFILGLSGVGLLYELAYFDGTTWTAGAKTPISA